MATTPSQQFHDLIGKAIVDKDFRDLLYTDRAAAIAGFQLSDVEIGYLDQIDRDILETEAKKVASGLPAAIICAPASAP
jgi:hypothetical protein